MADDNLVARTMHDVGLAAWFGGTLMGAVGLNGAAGAVDEPKQRLRVANAGWSRWAPVSALAIGTHALGGLLLIGANKGRIAAQEGVGRTTIVKSAVTAAAVGATAWSGVLGSKLQRYGDVPVQGGTSPSPDTPEEVARAQRQLKVLQWAIPALTGAVLVLNARMGEQQRPKQVAGGFFRRLAA